MEQATAWSELPSVNSSQVYVLIGFVSFSRYCAALYDGLKSCPQERHVHVLCDTDYIAHLIGRAEPELAGG